MSTENEHLDNLAEIRSLMERSSRFISLSGLCGVFAGLFAIGGAIAAHWAITSPEFDAEALRYFLVGDALIILVASLAASLVFTMRKARKAGLAIWDSTAKRLLVNLMIPLATGGAFCIILLVREQYLYITPLLFIFYGLGLLNASRYTLQDIRYLGIIQILIGLAASLWPQYILGLWILGFGIMHIVYGITMYYKYER